MAPRSTDERASLLAAVELGVEVTHERNVDGCGDAAQEVKLFDCRDAYSQALEAMAASDPRVCALVSDSVSSTKLKSFSQKFPDRFVNVGIAEQNLVGVGAGLANSGMVPFVRRVMFFDGARYGTNQGGPWLLKIKCEVVRHVLRHGLRRTRSDASFY